MMPVAGIHAEIHQLTSSEDTARTFLMSRTTSRGEIEKFHTDYAQVLSIFTGTGSRTNAIKDARISKSTFYLNKAITELHIVKPEVFQQEVHSAITNNLQLSEFSLRCKEVLVSCKDELKALKKAKKIF